MLRCSKFIQAEIIFVCNVCRKLVETVGNSTLGRRKQPKLTKAAPNKSVAFESLESSKVKMRIFRPPPCLGRWPEYSRRRRAAASGILPSGESFECSPPAAAAAGDYAAHTHIHALYC